VSNPGRSALPPILVLIVSLLFAVSAFAAGGNAAAQALPNQPALEARLADWDATAERAEAALREGTASDAAFALLRAEIAAQRGEAFDIITRGNIAGDVIRARLDALGPPPGKDGSEPEMVAERRAELAAQLAEADAPVRAVREAYNRSEVLIARIDSLQRSRFRASLMQRDPSPLVPTRWLPAATELGQFFQRVAQEARDSLASDAEQGQDRQRLVAGSALAGAGLVLLFFIGPALRPRLDHSALRARGWRRHVIRSAALLLRLFVPALAAGLIVGGYLALDLDLHVIRDTRTTAVMVAVLMVGASWVADLVFAPGAPERRAIALDENMARIGRRICLVLGAILSLQGVLEAAARYYDFAPATRSIVSGLIVFAGSAGLLRIASLLLRADADAGAAGGRSEKDRQVDFLHLLARLVQVSATAALVAVAIGYVSFARQALDPMILTLALIALGFTCYRGLIYLARLVLARPGQGDGPLLIMLPLVFGLVIILAVQPMLALAWGAQFSDLTEIWVALVQGVVIGGTRISIGSLSVLLAVFLIGIVATRWLQRLLSQAVLPRTRLDQGGQNAVLTGVGYGGVTLSALVAVSMAGLDLSNLAIVAGALSVGIGFGLQAIVSNFVSGIILLVERPIKEGDWIEVSGQSGIVRKIAVRATRIETFDRHDVIVPNSDLITGTVKNMTLSSRSGRLILPIGVAYGSDLETTRRIILDAASHHPVVLDDPAPVLLFGGLGESSLDFELRCFLQDVSSGLSTKSDLLYEIYRGLGAAGIEIPFPQRDLNLRNVEELAKAVVAVIEAGRSNASAAPGGGPAAT